ncbi:MAG: hypothetical protein WB616_13390 [Candidatus Sulfotelmatobacter sp.]
MLRSAFAVPKDNPDQIRERTAKATEKMKRDAKTVPEGVKEGMSSDKAITVNKASREHLLSLPGLTEHEVDRIIADVHSTMPMT